MQKIKEKIAELFGKEVKEKREKVLSLIELPQQQFGDYAFPCFFLATKQKKNPAQIATELAMKIEKRLPKEISKIEVKGAYINFFIDRVFLFNSITEEIEKKKDKFGSAEIGKGKKVLIEHTSINPNASPHVGRIRNALIGDSIARLFRFQDYKTEVHYYVNDVSKQVAMLVLGCSGKEKFEDILKIYIKMAKKAEKDKKIEKQIFEILNKFEAGDKNIIEKINKIVKIAVGGQQEIFNKLGIEYDFFDYESRYLRGKEIPEILSKLKKTGKLLKDEENRLVLNQAGTEVEKEMKAPFLVLTRSDGTGLYPLRDIAYTIDKLKRADKNIIILGEEQKLYFKQIKNALELLGYKAPEVVHYSFVLLQSGEKRKKMSTRKGELILLTDFLNEAEKKAAEEIKKRKTTSKALDIALSAVKYSILKTEENKNIIFSWDEALNFEGNSGPYLQYAYARASSILKKARKGGGREKDLKGNSKETLVSLNEKEISLIKQLMLFPIICTDATEKLRPHLLATYSFKLAQIFNDFYESCPVIKAEQNEKNARLKIVEAFCQVMKNAFSLLGIKAIEVM